MRYRKALATDDDETKLNISPLIDMVFILLIFFIVTTVFVEEPGVDVIKPFAMTAEDLQRNCILIAVTPAGQVVYGGREIGISGVRSVVRRLLTRDYLPVILQVDENATAEVVIRVIEEARLAGGDVKISTEIF